MAEDGEQHFLLADDRDLAPSSFSLDQAVERAAGLGYRFGPTAPRAFFLDGSGAASKCSCVDGWPGIDGRALEFLDLDDGWIVVAFIVIVVGAVVAGYC